MKKCVFAIIAIALTSVIYGCSDDKKDEATKTAAPAMAWEANPDFGITDIAEQMDINIRITAEAGIGKFVVTVNSETLAPFISYMTTDGSADMDLIGDTKLIGTLSDLGIAGLPMGDDLKNKTDVLFSLSGLVPMIAALGPADGSEHTFILKMADNENRTLTRELKFRYVAPKE
ncbi:MAG: hypothetical protein J6K28_02765 [Alistipes sp.]|nr:hypothetical protein [Alistipes sp.]